VVGRKTGVRDAVEQFCIENNGTVGRILKIFGHFSDISRISAPDLRFLRVFAQPMLAPEIQF
jgi:hypothetical protein